MSTLYLSRDTADEVARDTADEVTPLTSSPNHPKLFFRDFKDNCKTNTFSKHDNRHSLQNKGEYFSNGLGKKRLDEKCQHRGDNLTCQDINIIPSHPLYKNSFENKQASKCKFTRFPRIYKQIESTEKVIDLTTSTTKWWPDIDSHRTDLHVLASTQTPHAKSNTWKYSYQPTIFSLTATKSFCKTPNKLP